MLMQLPISATVIDRRASRQAQVAWGARIVTVGGGAPVRVIETVGVGQTEIDIAEIADTVCYVAQPASGDHVHRSGPAIHRVVSTN